MTEAQTGLGAHATNIDQGIPPAVTADTTPPSSGVEIPPPPPGTLPAPGTPSGIATSGEMTYSGPGAQPIMSPATPVSAPAPIDPVTGLPIQAPTAASTIPTWAWVLGGVALLGILGTILWVATRDTAAAVTTASKPNPLMMGDGTRRRKVKRRRVLKRGRRRGR